MLEKTSGLSLGMEDEEDEYVVQCEGREISTLKKIDTTLGNTCGLKRSLIGTLG